MEIPFTNWCLILHLLISLDKNNKETANIWEYQVGIYAIISNSVCIWKNRVRRECVCPVGVCWGVSACQGVSAGECLTRGGVCLP